MLRLIALFTLCVATTLVATSPRVHASELTQGSPCMLIEGLPGAKAPIRKVRSLRNILRTIDNPKAPPEEMGKRFKQLEALVHTALDKAKRVFHDTPRRDWAERDQKRARRYLERHVLGKRPLLQLGTIGFEPRQGLRAAMMYSACRSGDTGGAIRWGRRASRREEAPARAFAALLLLDQGRQEEAKELLSSIRGPSYLTAWIRAELSDDPDERRRQRAVARRRVTTGAQQDASAAQARRAEAQ
jgi:hypothetical protein